MKVNQPMIFFGSYSSEGTVGESSSRDPDRGVLAIQQRDDSAYAACSVMYYVKPSLVSDRYGTSAIHTRHDVRRSAAGGSLQSCRGHALTLDGV